MATRVRKLARELRVSPETVLGLLHALGIERYRSPEDMLPDTACQKVRKGMQRGIRPAPVEIVSKRKARAAPAPSEPTSGGLMDRLVPGIERSGQPSRSLASPQSVSAQASAPIDMQAVKAREAALEEETAALRARVAALEQREETLRLDERRLVMEREALRSERAAESLETVAALFAHRGLKGRDEVDRALQALAKSHLLGELFELLAPLERGEVVRFLRERLLLVGGTIPAGVGRIAAITVAPERADVPGEEVLGKLVARVGEELMLSGLKHVVLVGGPSLWQRMLRERLDGRIELRVVAADSRSEAEARDDVAQSEVIVLWQASPTSGAEQVYSASDSVVVRVEEASPVALFEQWVEALRS